MLVSDESHVADELRLVGRDEVHLPTTWTGLDPELSTFAVWLNADHQHFRRMSPHHDSFVLEISSQWLSILLLVSEHLVRPEVGLVDILCQWMCRIRLVDDVTKCYCLL